MQVVSRQSRWRAWNQCLSLSLLLFFPHGHNSADTQAQLCKSWYVGLKGVKRNVWRKTEKIEERREERRGVRQKGYLGSCWHVYFDLHR